MVKFIKEFLKESVWISSNLDINKISLIVKLIKECKKKKWKNIFSRCRGECWQCITCCK